MPSQPAIQYGKLEDLSLDPRNPRLGREHTRRELGQEGILALMEDWALEELAVSFLESGFWPQEALIVVEEELYGKECLVVVEGNRRLAALKYLKRAFGDEHVSTKWTRLVSDVEPPHDLFAEIPFIKMESRDEVDGFLGFRHVTGIKQWRPAEKAEFIAKLIEEKGLNYREATRRIGSKEPVVRRNYISYRILLQMEDLEEKVSLEHVEEKFSVLYLSLRELGVQTFLDVDISAPPGRAMRPVPKDKLDALAEFALWLFGTDEKPPLFTDSRYVTRFSKILQSERAVDYLRKTDHPSFEVAAQKAGADEPELVALVERATDDIEQVLGRVHLYADSQPLQKAVDRFGLGGWELVRRFPKTSAFAAIQRDFDQGEPE